MPQSTKVFVCHSVTKVFVCHSVTDAHFSDFIVRLQLIMMLQVL